MAINPISTGNTTSSLFQGGRLDSLESVQSATYLSYKAVVVGGDVQQFQFPQGATTGLTFGTPQSCFIDNSNNVYEMTCNVVNTGQAFIVPARTSGIYILDAVAGSTIEFTSAGTSAGKVNFTFYNYRQTPFVWYAYGSAVSVSSVPNGADVAMGSTTDAPATVPVNPNTLISVAKGIFNTLLNGSILVQGFDGTIRRSLLTDNTGRLLVVGSAAGNAVYGPDATGVAPSQPPVYTAGLDSGNVVRPFSVTNLGYQNVVVTGTPTFTISGTPTVNAVQSGAWNVTNITGTITLPTGAATEASLVKLPLAQGSTTLGQSGPLMQAANLAAEPALTTAQTSPITQTLTGRVRVESAPRPNATSAVTSVAASAANVTLLSANANAKQRTVFNESASAVLYLKLGATASVTSYTVQILANGYYEIPGNYTGIIDGIWSAAVGSARITEIS